MKGLKESPQDIESNKQAGQDLLEELGVDSPAESGVLIFEDDKVASKLLQKIIRDLKFRVRSYEDPLLALKEANDYQVAMLFLDIKLPKMNGLEFLSKLREQKKNSEFPVIVMTGYTQKEMVQEILKHNVEGLLAKPMDLKRAGEYTQKFGVDARL